MGRALLAELTREVRELDLLHLKIYSASGTIQFSTDAGQIGTQDRSSAFVAATERGASSVVHKTSQDGSALYELYVLVPVPGNAPAVFELYEPVDHLNVLLWRAGIAAAGVPSAILIALMLGMTRLVMLAQKNIDSRAALVTELRARLERLLSGAASQAVHDSVSAGGIIKSSRTRCTILYSDIRSFTSFVEANEPERVVQFLNQTMTIIVGAITRAGGDVDKLIGDAVLARFQGIGSGSARYRRGARRDSAFGTGRSAARRRYRHLYGRGDFRHRRICGSYGLHGHRRQREPGGAPVHRGFAR